MATLTLRIYKNEMDATRLAFIRGRFDVFEESEKVLTVEGSKEDILNLFENQFSDDAKFKAAFPDFRTYVERVEYTDKVCEKIKCDFAQALCEIINNGESTPEFKRLREIYLKELSPR